MKEANVYLVLLTRSANPAKARRIAAGIGLKSASSRRTNGAAIIIQGKITSISKRDGTIRVPKLPYLRLNAIDLKLNSAPANDAPRLV